MGFPVTALPMLRMEVPALGFAASVMPPDRRALPDLQDRPGRAESDPP